jgi:hypothetical protein
MSGRLAAIAAAVLLIGGALAIAAPAAAVAKPGKIRACVDKRGPDKGAMRFAGKGRCNKGERKLTWNKRGEPGATGDTGAQGPAGTGATDLLALIEQQASTIETLQSQLAVLGTRMAAVCSQVATLTTRADALRSVIAGIGLDGVIPVGLVLDVPGLPPPLSAFSCP